MLIACGQTTPSTPSAGNDSTPVAKQTEAPKDAGFEVRVMLNGNELASYNQSGPRTLVLNDEETLTMFLSSKDNKNVLTLVIQGTKPGNYPLPGNDNAPKPGQARLEFMHDETPPMRIATNGEVRLESFTGALCSGTFKGTGTDINGGKFSIEGRFTNLGVGTPAAN